MWTQPEEPNSDSHYDHVMCDTPLGKAIIEWKSWKESDSYSLTVGDEYVCQSDSLDEAKEALILHFQSKVSDLQTFIMLYYNGE
jgi:hypothetical protein